jgi:hypothetical protein
VTKNICFRIPAASLRSLDSIAKKAGVTRTATILYALKLLAGTLALAKRKQGTPPNASTPPIP